MASRRYVTEEYPCTNWIPSEIHRHAEKRPAEPGNPGVHWYKIHAHFGGGQHHTNHTAEQLQDAKERRNRWYL